VDLCLRAHEAGWDIWYVPEAVVRHAIGKSTDQVANRAIRMFHHSMWLFYRKHYLHKVPLPLRPLVPLGLWLRGSAYVTKNRIDVVKRWLGR
jgi:GT2 family glycosyltransferase